jgi:phage-related minor tail protein
VKRGSVVPEAAIAWSNGHLRASEYFAQARRRAMANAIRAVHEGLRQNGSGRPHRPA